MGIENEKESPSEERSYQRDVLRDWMKERFDKVDKDNEEIAKDLKTISDTVIQHSTYWGIVKWALISSGGVGAAVLSFFGLHPSAK